MKAPFSVLTICGIEELDAQGERGVTHVLSIIDPDLPDPEVFGRFPRHRRTLLRFHDIIEPDPALVLPQVEDVEAILGFGRDLEAEGAVEGHLLVHCHMGVSRSTAAMAMVLAQAHPEIDEREIADRVRTIRPVAWPNLRMITMADEILGREGKLVAAAARLYAAGLADKPWLEETMSKMNRAREVPLGIASRG